VIRLHRQELPQAAKDYLARVTKRISDAPDEERAEVAARAWKNKSAQRFREVRSTLGAMCSGIERCMYCEDSEWTAVEHFVPRSHDALLSFEWSNYLAACSGCNSNYKRDEFPTADDGTALLIDPTQEEPADYLVLSPTTGLYVAIDNFGKGSESIRVFGLNRSGLVTGRQDAWELLQLAVIAYAAAHAKGDPEGADRYGDVIRRQPFAGVLEALVSDDAGLSRSAEFLTALEARPEVRTWPQALFAPA